MVAMLGLTLIGIGLSGQSVSVLPAEAASTTPTGQRLRALAPANFLIGYASANNFWTLGDAAQYEATASAEYNVLTPENQMKWATIEPAQNSFDFSAADQHVAFAQAHGMAVHGHNLAWGAYNPSWLTNGSWTAATLTNVLYNHIDNVVGHYKGKIAVWDVVNEPINTPGIWQNVIGSSYIDLALRRAHTDDPAACLVINEYGDETLGGAGDAMYSLAQGLVQSGSPLCGIGMQFHVDENGVDYNSFASNMARFAALGLKIYITEMDVRLPATPSSTDLSNQALVYQNVLDKCMLQPACAGLQTWGFTDKYSWIPGYFTGMGAALPFDSNYIAKPAYYALQTRLGGTRATGSPTPTPVTVTASANFVGQDGTSEGNWKGTYGSQAYWLDNDLENLPSYVSLSSNASTWVWAASTSDPRALQKASSTTDRVAAAWYNASQWALDLYLLDGQPHKVSVYAVDFDNGGRSESVDVVDAASGVVLDHRSLSSFTNGDYLSWTVTGHVQVRATRTAGANAVMSALFVDPAAAPSATATATPAPATATPTSVPPTATPTSVPATATATPTSVPPTATPALIVSTATPTASSGGPTASFVGQDATTAGNWKGIYGTQAYSLEGDGLSFPTYASDTMANASTWTWVSSTTDPRALEKAASTTDRLAATWYSNQFVSDVNLTDGQLHKLSVYAVDWDQNGRSESLDVINPTTGVVLDHRGLSGFGNGAYMSWNVTGHVQVRVTLVAGSNAVISGLFLDPTGPAPAPVATATPVPNAASFVGQDATTSGNWKGVYGATGYWLEADGMSLPTSVGATWSSAQTWTWAASTSDPRGLQKALSTTDRLAAAWYGYQYVADITLTDGQQHKLSLYGVDWDQKGRAEAIDVLDPSTGNVLDHRTLSSFGSGDYLSWKVTGHVQLRVTLTAGANAVVSGLFLD